MPRLKICPLAGWLGLRRPRDIVLCMRVAP
jgi:hypothetical protein